MKRRIPFFNDRKRPYSRAIASFLLFSLLNQILTPSVALALTAGPTSPEATSFEPIDTTDMVNPLTGDFAYSLPLLEVPGPEGGYPLALSYHAGIQPNEEASWVGLGWSLNPGAITRNVNGFADDFNDVTQTARDYWAGGSRTDFGVSLGLPSGVTFGLSFSNDTFQGFGGGSDIGFGIPIGGMNSPLGIGVQYGVDAYGNRYAGAGLKLAGKGARAGLGLSGSIGISTNFNSVGGYVGASFASLGVSMSSGSTKPQLTIGGGSLNVHNANAGKIKSESSGFNFGIPLGVVTIGIKYKHTRYWSDESANVLTQGSLYMPRYQSTQSYYDNRTGDMYRIADHKNAYGAGNEGVPFSEPDKMQGGTFPAYDDYMVSAQGLGGSIRPYIFQAMLNSQNIRTAGNTVVQTTGTGSGWNYTGGVQFRFVNDFSNSYKQGHPDIGTGNIFSSAVYGNNDSDAGYNNGTGRLEGSKHIEWFTNAQISSGSAKTMGFIDTRSAGFSRLGPGNTTLSSEKGGEQVGGYMITNSSGVTYHYALPAYSFGEFTKTSLTDDSKWTSQTRTEPYAYTWFLTAITGADYVDRNNNGLADEGDWGYWVCFDYGKWTNYEWRNPSEGFHSDIDKEYKNYSKGTKQVYYLDAIKTRTHTALFVKELRADAKATASESFEPNVNITPFPVASLKLNNIMLFANEDLPQSIGAIREANTGYDFNITTRPSRSQNTYTHYSSNVIDIKDLETISPAVSGKCLRKIQFNYDYSLCQGVPNSYDEAMQMYSSKSPALPSNTTKLGKLTLLSVDFQGKGAAKISPPVRFEYDLNPDDPGNRENVMLTGSITGRNGFIQVLGSTVLQVGDIIKISVGSNIYYCTLLSRGSNVFSVLYLDKIPPSGSVTGVSVKTKNPPYNKDAYDIWGLYKSDYVNTGKENMDHFTTLLSNKGTDVWSLRKIRTSVGADLKINYEGDTFSKSVLTSDLSYRISACSAVSNNRMTLTIDPGPLNIHELFSVGDKVDFLVIYRYYTSQAQFITERTADYGNPVIEQISGNQITVKGEPALMNVLNKGSDKEIIAGNISPGINRYSGGGTRVRSIEIDGLDGFRHLTEYTYNQSGNAQLSSSGVTSYEPVGLPVNNDIPAIHGIARTMYKKALYRDVDGLLTVSREVPAPGVMYEYVTVTDKVIAPDKVEYTLEGKTVYNYRVLNAGMIGVKEYQYDAANHRKNLSIKDYTSQVGNLLRTIHYDDKGNKLMEQVNHYINDGIVNQPFEYQADNYEYLLSGFNYQGIMQERYGDARSFDRGGVWQHWLTMSGRDVYPAIHTGTTFIDYKNGTKTEQKNLAFDFYSGEITSVLTTDSYGNRYNSVTVPAYRISEYSAMGLKTNDLYSLAHKHMLTQEAASYTYKVNSQNQKIGLVAASVETWSNNISILDENDVLTTSGQANIWRKKSGYSWLPANTSADNLTPISEFTDFSFTSGSTNNTSWKKSGEVTKYNIFSAGLEASDINSMYSVSRMGYKSSRVVVSCSPSRYEEVAFAGVEDGLLTNGKFSTGISPGGGTISTAAAHTGSRSLLIPSGQNGFSYQVAFSSLDPVRRDYVTAVWVKADGGNANGARLYYQIDNQPAVYNNPSFQKTAAGWYLLEMKIPAAVLTSGNTITIGCRNNGNSNGIFFDDFRFQPLNGVSSAYVYDNSTGELTHVLDNNNLYIKFEYDAAGRLIKTFKEVLGKSTVPMVKHTIYNYGKF